MQSEQDGSLRCLVPVTECCMFNLNLLSTVVDFFTGNWWQKVKNITWYQKWVYLSISTLHIQLRQLLFSGVDIRSF